MTQRPHRRLSDRAVAKLFILAILSLFLATAMTADSEAPGPFWVNLLAASFIIFGAFGIYEFASTALGTLLGQTALSEERRAERGALQDIRTGPFGARQALMLLAAYVGAQAVVWVPIGVLAAGEEGQIDPDRLQPFLAPGVLLSLIAAGIAALLMFRMYARRSYEEGLDLRRAIGLQATSLPPSALAGITGLVLGSVVVALSYQIPLPEDYTPGVLARAAQSPGIAQYTWVFVALVLAPPLEEFVFRGAMFEGLRRSWGPYVAGILVTALFVGMHLPEVSHYWPALLGVTLGGIGMLLARVWSGSLAPAVALHFAYNLVVAIGALGARLE